MLPRPNGKTGTFNKPNSTFCCIISKARHTLFYRFFFQGYTLIYRIIFKVSQNDITKEKT